MRPLPTELLARVVREARPGLGVIVLTLLLACGCAALSRQKASAESSAKCRELSREGVVAMERGEADMARSLLEKAVDAGPNDADARRQLAEVLWQCGANQEAIVHMEAAVRLDADDAPTLVRSGEMLLARGAVERALSRAETAIALDRSLAEAWALRGRVCRQRGDADQALADLHQALRFKPDAADVLFEVAELHYSTGRPQRALTTLHRLLDGYPPDGAPVRALWLEGLAYSSMDRPADAVASLQAAVQCGEPSAELLCQLARAQHATGDHAAASTTAQRALAVDGSHEASRLLLAQLQAADAGGTILR